MWKFCLKIDKIISATLSSRVTLFLRVNHLKIQTTFNKTLILKQNQSNIQAQQNYIPEYVSTTRLF